MSDAIAALRERLAMCDAGYGFAPLGYEQADHILRAHDAEVGRLRGALRYIRDLPIGDEPDIARRAARRTLEKIKERCDSSMPIVDREHIRQIEQAVAAERERCARMVERWSWGREDLLAEIAAAIRKGEP